MCSRSPSTTYGILYSISFAPVCKKRFSAAIRSRHSTFLKLLEIYIQDLAVRYHRYVINEEVQEATIADKQIHFTSWFTYKICSCCWIKYFWGFLGRGKINGLFTDHGAWMLDFAWCMFNRTETCSEYQCQRYVKEKKKDLSKEGKKK